MYGDRPWGCRMYPVGKASPDRNNPTDREDVYFLVDQEFPCHGFSEEKQWTVEEWKKAQGVEEYELKGGSYKDITLHRFFLEGNRLNAEKTIEDIKSNEESLLDFGHRWIRFSLFREDTIRVKGDVLEERKRELGLWGRRWR